MKEATGQLDLELKAIVKLIYEPPSSTLLETEPEFAGAAAPVKSVDA